MNVFPPPLFNCKKRRTTEENNLILTGIFKIKISRYILWALNIQPKYDIFDIHNQTLSKNTSSFNKKRLEGSNRTNIYVPLRYCSIYVIFLPFLQ